MIRILYIGVFFSVIKFVKIREMYNFFICVSYFWWFKKFFIVNCNGYDYCVFDILWNESDCEKMWKVDYCKIIGYIILYIFNLISNSEDNMILNVWLFFCMFMFIIKISFDFVRNNFIIL